MGARAVVREERQMLSQMSIRQVGGNLPEAEQAKIEALIVEFEKILAGASQNIPPKFLRIK